MSTAPSARSFISSSPSAPAAAVYNQSLGLLSPVFLRDEIPILKLKWEEV